jgi:hypothetical protein
VLPAAHSHLKKLFSYKLASEVSHSMPSPTASKRPRSSFSSLSPSTCRQTLRFALSIAADFTDGLVLSGGHSAGSCYIFAIRYRNGSDASLPADLPARLSDVLSSWIAADCKIKKVTKDPAVVEAYLTERGLSSSLDLFHTRNMGPSPSCNEMTLPGTLSVPPNR